MDEQEIITIDTGEDAIVDLFEDYARKKYKKRATFDHELRILRQLTVHPNIIRVLSCDDAKIEIYLERFDFDLLMILNQQKSIDHREIISSLYHAVNHCHNSMLVHRDIKLENIFLKNNGHLVLGDFARGRFAPRTLHSITFDGTTVYGAPEALRGICDLKNDIWSLAIVIFCMIEKQMPFIEDDTISTPTCKEQIQIIEANQMENCFSRDKWTGEYMLKLQEILILMLETDYQKRVNIKAFEPLIGLKLEGNQSLQQKSVA